MEATGGNIHFSGSRLKALLKGEINFSSVSDSTQNVVSLLLEIF